MPSRQTFVFVLLFCITLTAEAHRQHVSWTSIVWNERTNSLEIIHRFHEHDVQLYLNSLAGKSASVTDLRGRAEFAVYLSDHFHMSVEPDTTASVNLLGGELEGPYLMVYQEIELSDPPTALVLRSEILMDLFPDQVNMVNIDINGIKQTLQFSKGDHNKQFKVGN